MRLLRRPARSGRDELIRQHRVVWQAASLLLAYPDADHHRRLDTVDELLAHLPEEAAQPLATAVRDLRRPSTLAAATTYVDTFDMRNRTTLLLTYWTDGDTRNRGAAILVFVRVYRAAGVEPPAGESADHLAVVLEFAATVDPDTGGRLLAAHRTAVDLLHERLRDAGSPYADVLGAVAATLPPATEVDRQRARELAQAGPPAESVGLQPFTLTVPPRRDRPRQEGLH
ncbi:nitrate reductase molybdenum cofactor assembly chaperone [Rhodococcus sp. NPDC003318]|uniref:nitrate reductase molybdenum cofactor assembly chaperone n=1 Tax=Rhodococcus sp. NPDC003318 TaxID=3364503 RepID=UPI0036CF8328